MKQKLKQQTRKGATIQITVVHKQTIFKIYENKERKGSLFQGDFLNPLGSSVRTGSLALGTDGLARCFMVSATSNNCAFQCVSAVATTKTTGLPIHTLPL